MNSRNWVLLGNESLLIQCGELLAGTGRLPQKVYSDDSAVLAWAASRGVPHESPSVAVPGPPGSIDYLVTVGDPRFVGGPWLALACEFNIHFHDGPLPDYAGYNVTAWALLHGERRYGVTWHLVDPGGKPGDILEQELFDIGPEETALTLNAKCFEAGILGFERLLEALHGGGPRRRPMPDGGRWFGPERRPAGAGYVDLGRPAEEVDRLVRALDFGGYANPLCLPWTLRDGRVHRWNGRWADGSGAFRQHEPVTGETLGRITALHQEWSAHEAFWVDRLATLQPAVPPRLATIEHASGEPPAAGALETLPGLPESRGAVSLAHVLAFLARALDQEVLDVALVDEGWRRKAGGVEPWFELAPPLRVRVNPQEAFEDCLTAIGRQVDETRGRGGYLRDLVLRYPALRGRYDENRGVELPIRIDIGAEGTPAGTAALVLRFSPDLLQREWAFDPRRLSHDAVEALRRQCAAFLDAASAAPRAALRDLPIVPALERQRLLEAWNATARPVDDQGTPCEQFEAQVARTPDAIAVVSGEQALTWRELDRRATALATRLRANGVEREALVGLHLPRTVDLLVGIWAVLKARGAYLPLDPAYPADRLAFMISDARPTLVLTHSAVSAGLAQVECKKIEIDVGTAREVGDTGPLDRPRPDPGSLAYVIYTSGSTGRPKGVMIENRNVTNFFAAMDEVIDAEQAGVWLALTSLSFDIAVLELLWTTCRGFRVVLHDDVRGQSNASAAVATRPPTLSLFYFASDEGEGLPAERYRLLTEGARFADRNGFEAVWTPERHFHAFGGLYPNPAVTSAAIATITERVAIRAGSVVMPLHHPVRVAEDFAVVDNLSGGRVGIAFASGWHPNDFVFFPQNFARAKQALGEGMDVVRRLWRGESVEFDGPTGKRLSVKTLPRPIQPELPFWITTAGNPETYRMAAAQGANVLTHLLGQSIEEVAEKIRIYRQAWKDAGHAGPGRVTLMLHAYVGRTDDEVRELVREPMKRYLGSSLNLVKQHAWSFPAFKGRSVSADAPTDEWLKNLSAADLDALLEHSFDRYFATGSLFGSVATCAAMMRRLSGIGVDEVACLVDFGLPSQTVLGGLQGLADLQATLAGAGERRPPMPTLAENLATHAVTHFQCTPSLASMLLEDEASRVSLSRLKHWLVGGEALPPALADRMRALGVGRLTNMYGPTETTVWSLHGDFGASRGAVTIGRPLANTQLFVLDAARRLLPIGAEGELYIGGAGVARGYLGRPELTQARFAPSLPGVAEGAVSYRTGDRVRYRDDGQVEFLGRIDHQVKLRGHRIEPGEIEALLAEREGVRDAVVVLREDEAGDARLVAYVTPSGGAALDPSGLLEGLKSRLPPIMVPSVVVVLEALPQTPNGKVDRLALPRPERSTVVPARAIQTPTNDLERQISRIWCDVLRLEAVGIDDNFFDIGGHSVLTVQVLARLKESLGRNVPITDVFRFPTVRRLAQHLSVNAGGGEARSDGSQTPLASSRAAARLAARAQRRSV